MKKNYLFLIFLFLLSSIKAYAIPRCDQFYQSIYNDTVNTDVFHDTNENKKVIGIRLKKFWNEEKEDETFGFNVPGWDLETNQDGYFKVGKVTKYNYNIKVDDVILSINGIDLREIAKNKKNKKILEADVSDLFEEDEEIIFELQRNVKGKPKIFLIDNIYGFNSDKDEKKDKYKENEKLYNSLQNYDSPYLDFYINSMSLDEKEGTFSASIETSFLEELDAKYYLTKKVWDDLIFDKKFNENNKLISFQWEYCPYNEEQWKNLHTVDPAAGLRFDNVVRENKNTKTSSYTIKPIIVSKENFYTQDSASIEYTSTNNYTFNNKFNLRTFPFDKQTIKIFLYNYRHNINNFKALVSSYTARRALEFKNLNNIEGWDITNVETKYELYQDPNINSKHDGVSIVFELERKSSYYVFKIILPILLILIVCWSSIWINPREIESRLTITIVCLLSLIAYNFVIDSDLPKLEYLTIMDYIILISYVYATIPNFLAIACFNLMKKNKALSNKLEFYGKKFGLPSYILTIFIIIIYNTSVSPEFTNSMLSWMIS